MSQKSGWRKFGYRTGRGQIHPVKRRSRKPNEGKWANDRNVCHRTTTSTRLHSPVTHSAIFFPHVAQQPGAPPPSNPVVTLLDSNRNANSRWGPEHANALPTVFANQRPTDDCSHPATIKKCRNEPKPLTSPPARVPSPEPKCTNSPNEM